MKKSHLSISGYIHLMIILLLLLEAGWLYSLYHAERRDFRYVTGKFIEDAIKEEIHTCPIQETNGLDDFSMKGRLIMTYTYKGKYFHIDTNSQPTSLGCTMRTSLMFTVSGNVKVMCSPAI